MSSFHTALYESRFNSQLQAPLPTSFLFTVLVMGIFWNFGPCWKINPDNRTKRVAWATYGLALLVFGMIDVRIQACHFATSIAGKSLKR